MKKESSRSTAVGPTTIQMNHKMKKHKDPSGDDKPVSRIDNGTWI